MDWSSTAAAWSGGAPTCRFGIAPLADDAAEYVGAMLPVLLSCRVHGWRLLEHDDVRT
jgi:hypothetical protein